MPLAPGSEPQGALGGCSETLALCMGNSTHVPFLPSPTEDLEDDDDDEDELDRELDPEDVKEEVSPASMHGSILKTAFQSSCLLCLDSGRGGSGCQPHSSMVAP